MRAQMHLQARGEMRFIPTRMHGPAVYRYARRTATTLDDALTRLITGSTAG